MYEYLDDIEFLQQLDKLNLRTHYVKIILLSFDEKPIKEIQGTITSGSMNVNGSSAVRRTISLSMLASFVNVKIDDVDNEISVNKKIKIFIGLSNPIKEYQKYGTPVWFPLGLYIISSASISRSTSGWNISINGKDKMCLLDGTAGGVIPASVTFHEREIELKNGDREIQFPTIHQIIYEAVNHWGGERSDNIFISDIDEKIKMLVKYMGDTPICFSSNFESMIFSKTPIGDFRNMYTYGQDIGYQETDFTYPGELILNAGDTVVTLLDKIRDFLGNYEYYYDVHGRFIFQQIKNYLNMASPLTEVQLEDYTKSYNNAKFLYSLTDLDTTTAITKSPKYDNLKNDFYVWGKRITISGVEQLIRYHLAVDAKPEPNLIRKYMWEVTHEDTGLLLRYDFTDSPTHTVSGYVTKLIGPPCSEWREELYRRALVAQTTVSISDNYYDSEMIAEWRNLYDPTNEDWARTGYYQDQQTGAWGVDQTSSNQVFISRAYWNPDVFNDPGNINFWIDFIDTGTEMGKYSISQIGRRTKVVSNDDLKTVYNNEVPDIIFIEGPDQNLIATYRGIGQKFFILTKQNYDLFSISSTGASCYDKVRELMYQNLSYNTTIQVTCLPKYYIEPNNIIYIEDKDSGISGNYQITQFNLPLAHNGIMSITATEVLTRI